MQLFTDEIVKAMNGRSDGTRRPIHGVTTDTRSLRKGDLFFALRGPKFDGHRFIPDAISKNASYVVSEEPTAFPGRTILVEDTLYALGELARYYRSKLKLRIVAITGSNGKTTTKDMTAAMLSSKAPTHKSPASYNNLIGVPLTILQLEPRHKFAVVELGMNRRGEIARECDIIRPDLGVLTNIAPAHIGFFGSLSEIAEAKAELLTHLDHDKIALLNGDDSRVIGLSGSTRAKVIMFSIRNRSEYRATGVKYLKDRLRFRVKETTFEMEALGIENIYNALAAIGVGDISGISFDSMRDILKDFRLPHLRGTVQRNGGVTVINDSYNSNPSSLKAALRWLKLLEGKRKIAVLGDMLELGIHGKKYHLQAGRMARDHCDLLVGVGDLARYFCEGMGTRNAHHFSTREEALRFLKELVTPGDVLLVKGSRLMKMEKIADALLAFVSA